MKTGAFLCVFAEVGQNLPVWHRKTNVYSVFIEIHLILEKK